MTPLRQSIVAEALSWAGTPYHHQARLKGVGVDCVGLPIGVARALGLVPPDFDIAGYPRTPDGQTLIALCDLHMAGRVELVDMQIGDVLVQKFTATGPPQHMGIVVPHRDGLALLHAFGTCDGKGKVIKQRLDSTAIDRIVAIYRLPGVPA